MSNTVKTGDTHAITLTVFNDVGAAKDLTGATVRLLAKLQGSADPATVLTATLDGNPTTGKVHHTLTGLLAAGTYDVEVEVTLGGVKTTAPTEGYATLIVAPDLG
jgi:hypothetical protein